MLSEAPDTGIALFEAFPRLRESLPHLPLGSWPTPVTSARHFAAARGLRALYIKREDLSHPDCGGNKVRGLEFLLADARRRGAAGIVTLGAAGSHHIAKTAWHAGRKGIRTIALVLHQPPADYAKWNLLAGAAAGVCYRPVNVATLPLKLAWEMYRPSTWRHGNRPMFISPGGSSPLAALGHVSAALELKGQIEAGALPEPDYLYVALGSLGTAAGLFVGCGLAGLRTRLVGVVASYRWYCTARRWARFARRILRLLRTHDASVPAMALEPRELAVVTTALGRGYAQVVPEAAALAEDLHVHEPITADATYMSKALLGAMQHIEAHRLHERIHLLWHTYAPSPVPGEISSLYRRLPPALYRYL